TAAAAPAAYLTPDVGFRRLWPTVRGGDGRQTLPLLAVIQTDSRPHFLVVGGGPAGTSFATTAAARGARVTVIEKDIVGGAAHLWDCIPSKTMTASAVRIESVRNAAKLGLVTETGAINSSDLAGRIQAISSNINASVVSLLESQKVDLVSGFGTFL